MSWCTELPTELTCRPLGVISLVGIDVVNSPVHKTIWDSFAVNRQPQRVPLVFKNVPFSHQYPKSKPNRTSYDWYVPKGILKTNWMQKHLQFVPAVVVIFYDLEWDDPQWAERCSDLAAKVDLVRSSLQGRATKIGLVLVQKNAGLPGDQDLDQQQKAHMLCNRCGNIAAKSLFVLPYTEHLPGYVMRLENAFYEMSQNYYYAEGRRIKSYRELLNKTTHQLLFVRHQFKAAFFNELKQDPTSALRHYKQAYEHIKELRMYDSHMLEIKTIAGFVNYKICRISFQQSTPRDAIAQFRQHVDLFKHKIGIKDLAFEHSAWMAKQFCIFGELFSEAIGAGLTALITQHPGFYFQQAANYTVQRRRQCLELCLSAGDAAPPASASGDPLESIDKLDYYGQRPWRQGHQSIDPPEPAREREGIQALQRKERDVQHCLIIIPLLSSAVSQFKRYKSPRMKRYLIVQMGEEYYEAKEYAKALEHLSHVTWEYRNERWATLLHAILTITWRCAFLVGNVSAFVSASLELISDNIPETLLCVEEKSKIQSNLMRVLFLAAGNGCPEDSDLVSSVGPFTSKELESRWLRPTTDPPSSNTFNIDATSLASFVRVKAHFPASTFTADSLVLVDFYVVVSSPSPIEFSQLRVSFSDSAYDDLCVLEGAAPAEEAASMAAPDDDDDADDASPSLFFEPGVVKAFRFHFNPRPEDVGATLRITSVSLHLGDPARRCAVLTWNEGGGDVMTTTTTAAAAAASGSSASQTATTAAAEDTQGGGGNGGHAFWQRPPPKRKLLPEEEWRFIPRGPTTTTKIESRPPRVALTITHAPPCLVNEFYVVRVAVNNEEDVMVTDVTISVDLMNVGPSTTDGQLQQQTLEESTHLFVEVPTAGLAPPPPRVAEVPLPDLEAGQSCVKTFYVRVTQPGERRFAVLVNYAVEAVAGEPVTPPAPLHSSSNVVPALVSAADPSASSSDADPPRRRCLCLASTEFAMQSMRPFQIVTKPLTAKFEATEVVFDQEPFLLTCDIKCISEWPIQIKTSLLERSENMLLPEGETNLLSMLDNLTLQSHDVCRDLYCLVPSIGARAQQLQQQLGTAANLQIGHYTLEWRRTSVDGTELTDLPFVKSTMPLALVPCQSLPLSVDLKLPAYGTMRSPMSVRYSLENKTMLPQDLEIVIESSEGFMFSGQKQMTMRLLPYDHQDLVYNLFPLVAGNVTLPRLNVTMTRYPNLTIAEIVHKLIPSQIFVIPAKKEGGSSLPAAPPPPLVDAPLTDVAS